MQHSTDRVDTRKQPLPGALSIYLPPEYPAEVFLNAQTPPFCEDAQQTWHFFSYGSVLRILTDPTAFEISYAAPSIEASWTYAGLWSRSGRVHRTLRAAEAHAYTPRTVEQCRELIRNDAVALLAPVLTGADGHFEFIEEFAAPLSILAAARVMGLDIEADIVQLVHGMHANLQELQVANLGHLQGYSPLRDYISALLQQRTLSPWKPPRLLDTLIADRRLNDLDRLGVLWTQVIEASDTMASSLGYALLAFLQFGLIDIFRADMHLLPGGCEEALRFLNAFPAVFRVALRDLVLDGYEIARGQGVTGWLCAANRDKRVFPDPHSFDITRDNREQLAFGGGPHICLGKSLAQLIMPIAFAALIEAPLSGLRLDPDRQVERHLGINNSLLRLPLLFDMAGRVAWTRDHA